MSPAGAMLARRPLKPAAGGGIAITTPSAYWDLNATSWANGVAGGDPLAVSTGANLPTTATAVKGNALDNSATKTQCLVYGHNIGFFNTVVGNISGVDWSAALWFQPRVALPDGSSTFDDYLTLSDTIGGSSRTSFVMRLNNATQWLAFYTTTAGGGTDYTQVGAAITSPAPALNTWFFAMLRYSESTKTIGYSINDGTKSTANIGTNTIYGGSGQDLQVGTFFFLNNHVAQGYTDEVGWWRGHCLTDAEVTLLYNGGAGRTYFLGWS
jgi:hypothetical protein